MELKPIKVIEKFGYGILNQSGVATPRNNSYIQGHSQRVDLKAGMKEIPLNFDPSKVVADTLAVYKNGGESLTIEKDYIIDYKNSKLILKYPARALDDDVEIRCQIDRTDDFTFTYVTLLPREMGETQFTFEQLVELLPKPGDVFEVDKLLNYNNPQLVGLNGKQMKVLEAGIREKGIKGKMLLI